MSPALQREPDLGFAVLPPAPLLKAWPTLLIVDRDVEMVRALVCFFEKRGFHVAAADSLAEARELFQRRKFWTLVIADYHLADGNGWELCAWIREQNDATPVLLMSGSPYGSTLCAGTDYFAKPFPPEKLEDYLRKLPARR